MSIASLVSVIYSCYTGCDILGDIKDLIEDDLDVLLVLTTDPNALEEVVSSLPHHSVPYSEICTFSRLIRSVMNNEAIDDCQEIWSKLISYEVQYVLCNRERMWLIDPNVIGGLIEITPVKECYRIFTKYLADNRYLIYV